MNWQPIETAPRDGTEVLVYFDCATVPIVHIAWCNDAKDWADFSSYSDAFDSLEEYEGWWSYVSGSVSFEKLSGYREPTHWMPLPALPETVPLETSEA